MCGICGELRLDGAPADLSAVERMMGQLARRGPDHGGSYSDGVLGFGHRRLSIIDLSIRSNQPMVDPELGLALVFNGAIYNYPELRRELTSLGYRFFSEGDSETILKAWHAWGEKCVERLHGMFAFAIWDAGKRVLFLARDRFGIKPLYWTADAGRLRFASNTQALLEAGDVDTGIDPVALHHLFTLHAVVPAPRTVLAGIRKLAPGVDAHRGGRPEHRAGVLAPDRDPPSAAPERGRVAGRPSTTPCARRCASATRWRTCRWACCSLAVWTRAY